MSNETNYFTHTPKQDRSQARIEKILDVVERLITDSPDKKIDIKSISQKAHISVGAIYHHFPSIHSIFASLLMRKVQLRIQQLAIFIDSMSALVTINEFADQLINQAFYEWGHKPIASKAEALRFYYQNSNHPEFVYSFAHSLYPNVKAFIEKNQTNEFREISEQEWPFLNRISQTAILSPFLEELSIAGTDQHRIIVKDILLRIYSK